MVFYLFHYVLALGLTCASTFALGMFVYLKNRKNKINQSFFLFSLSMSLWSGFQMGIGSTSSKSLATFCIYPEQVAVILIPLTLMYFIQNLLEIKRKWPLKIGLILSLFFLVLLPTKLFVEGTGAHMVLKMTIKPGPLYIVLVIYLVSYLVFGLSELLMGYLHSTGARRNQLKYLFFGLLLAGVTGSLNFLYLFDVKLPLFFPFLNYGIPIYAFATAYAILRYRVMDIRVVIKKTVIYAVIYSFSVGVFAFLSIFIGQWAIYGHMDERLLGIGLFSIFIITLSLRPLDNLLTRLTDKYLFRKKYEYQKTLKAASRGMTRITSLSKLLDLIVRMIARSVNLTHATIFLQEQDRPIYVLVASRGKCKMPKRFIGNNSSDPLVQWLLKKKEALVYDEIVSQIKREPDLNLNLKRRLEKIAQEMQDLNVSVCIPSFIENKMIGFLMLGEKLSGDMYTQEDLDLFSTLANQAALAIENAQSYEELKDTRDQLLQSERLATIGKFANEVAHEIKNPLQAIKTFVEYLPQKYQDKAFRDKFGRIVGGEIERIDAFVRQLVGFSKPKSLEFLPIDINQLLDTTLLLLENDFKKRDCLIKRNYLKKELRFLADRNQLKQAFLNIFLNSLDAMDKNKSNQLTVESSTTDKQLVIKISDTGCGITQENISRLFEPFFTTKEKGSGLGLIIVKSIIENHNGEISVESKVSEGTTFLIKFSYLDKK